MTQRPDYVGEVIGSSTTRFTAECPDDDDVPAFGSFVAIDTHPGRVVAVVSDIRAGSFEQGRRPTAYGLAEDELYRQQPQLRDLLAVEFDALLIGHALDADSPARQLLPPRPPRLHQFVVEAAPADVAAVTAGGDYLRTLVAAGASDDLLAAAVRASLPAHADDPAFAVACGQALARLAGDDYERLQALLRRVSA